MDKGAHAHYIHAMIPAYDPANPSAPRIRKRAFRLLFICLMITGIGNSMLFAILPPLANELGVAKIYVGAIYTISAVLFLLMSPIWGALSDRYGRRPLLVLGLSSFCGSTLVFALGAYLGQAHLVAPLAAIAIMALARSIFGGIGSATNPSAQAYVADRTTSKERTKELASLTAAFGLGGVIGPALAAALAEKIGIAPFMLAAAIIVAGGASAVHAFLPEKSPPKVQSRPINPIEQFKFALDPRLTAFVIFGCALWLTQATSLQTLTFYIMDRLHYDTPTGLRMGGIALTSGAAALIFAQLVLIPILNLTPRILMGAGAVCTLIGNGIIAIASDYPLIIVGYMILSLGFGLARSGFTGGASLAVNPEEQGRAAGITTSTAGLGFMLAPIFGLWLYQSFGPSTPFELNMALALCALGVALAHPAVRRASTQEL